MRSEIIACMGSILDDLTFDPEIRGWDNIRAWYRGNYAGGVHACRDRKRGWWAGRLDATLSIARAGSADAGSALRPRNPKENTIKRAKSRVQ